MSAATKTLTQNVSIPPATIAPAEFARRYGIGIQKVLGWLDNGILTGVNVGNGERKKRWRIRPCDIAAFEARRANHAATGATHARTQRVNAEEVPGIDFFPNR